MKAIIKDLIDPRTTDDGSRTFATAVLTIGDEKFVQPVSFKPSDNIKEGMTVEAKPTQKASFTLYTNGHSSPQSQK
jgi:hypothetical protein